MKMRKRNIFLLSLLSLLIGLSFIGFLQEATLNQDTQRVRKELETIIQSNLLVTETNSMTILSKDSQSPATRAIRQGADYSRILSKNSLTITEAKSQAGKVLEYVSLTRTRTKLDLPIQLIILLIGLFYLLVLWLIVTRPEKDKPGPDAIIPILKAENPYAFTEFFQFPIFVFDKHGKIIFANAALRNEFIASQEIYQFSEHTDFLSFLLKKMLDPSLQDRLIHFDKLDADYEVNFRPLETEDHFLVTMNDVTVYRSAVNAQKELIANISHELKTPLTSIHGFAELLEKVADLPLEKRQEFSKLISQESLRLLDLVTDLISLSRPQVTQIETEPVVPRSIILSILKNLQRQIDQKRLIVEANLEDFSFLSHEKKLQVILKNLIENAIFYANLNGKITLCLSSSSTETSRKVFFSITNTGSGLNEIEKSQIFERFYRSSKASTLNPSGTGLGLAIVQKNLKELGGIIRVESQIGKDTTFIIEF